MKFAMNSESWKYFCTLFQVWSAPNHDSYFHCLFGMHVWCNVYRFHWHVHCSSYSCCWL